MASVAPQPQDWVPVERRLWGMDRTTLLPALVVAVFGILAFWGLPALNSAVSVTNPVRAGDVVQLGTSVQFTPAAGWDLAAGVRQGTAKAGIYPGTSQVVKDGVTFTIVADDYRGTPRQLLAQIRRNNDRVKDDENPVNITGRPVTFTTTTGQTGALARFTAGQGMGLLAAFVFDGTGVEVVASGPGTISKDAENDLVGMLESVRPVAGDGGGAS
jgi:hypothetical protein